MEISLDRGLKALARLLTLPAIALRNLLLRSNGDGAAAEIEYAAKPVFVYETPQTLSLVMIDMLSAATAITLTASHRRRTC